MRIKTLGAVVAAVALFGFAQVAGAQGSPGPGRGFGPHGGPGGPGGPGGMMGGRGCVATSSTPCPSYQFTFTISSTEPVLVNGSASTVTKTTTGTIAGDVNGSTYRDEKFSGMGGWASQGGPSEFILIKNLDPSVLLDYKVNVTKMTYEQFPIRVHTPRTPPANSPDQGPNSSATPPAGFTPPTRTAVTNYKISDGSYTCPAAEQISFSHTIQLGGSSGSATITDNRVYCTTLKILVEENHNDPRFGTRTYQLSGYMATPHVSFTPPSGFKLVEDKHAGHRGPMGGNTPPAQP